MQAAGARGCVRASRVAAAAAAAAAVRTEKRARGRRAWPFGSVACKHRMYAQRVDVWSGKYSGQPGAARGGLPKPVGGHERPDKGARGAKSSRNHRHGLNCVLATLALCARNASPARVLRLLLMVWRLAWTEWWSLWLDISCLTMVLLWPTSHHLLQPPWRLLSLVLVPSKSLILSTRSLASQGIVDVLPMLRHVLIIFRI